MDQVPEPTRYMVVYCKVHNFGKLIDLHSLQDEFDIEGNLRTLASCFNICPKGFFKRKTLCSCELHGVIDITGTPPNLTVDRTYGMPHERVYPKGWKLKYYICTQSLSLNMQQHHYGILKDYFTGRSV